MLVTIQHTNHDLLPILVRLLVEGERERKKENKKIFFWLDYVEQHIHPFRFHKIGSGSDVL